MRPRSSSRRGSAALVIAMTAALTTAGAFFLWGALRLGPAPEISLAVDRPAVGSSPLRITATFREPAHGLGLVTLELAQGDQVLQLGEKRLARSGVYRLVGGARTGEVTIEAGVDRVKVPWLKEGEVIVRARADRFAGSLRSAPPVVVERRLPVRFRPPRLEVLSQQHYVRQGGAGIVLLRVGPSATRSGVRAGSWESVSLPRPNGADDERACLFAVPWNLADGGEIRAFAEDDAGNRVELPFVTMYKTVPPRAAIIDLSDAFLSAVVPAIAAETPGFDTTGSLLDQYLRINGPVRRDTLARIVEMAGDPRPQFLWSGAFLQTPNTKRLANFAETRTYRYQGRPVDTQTHLGLDLASTAHAVVPAANAGTVRFAGSLTLYGNAVILEHGFGLATLYGHLSRIDAKVGQAVAKGETIGASGMTGLAGGDHLHFEVFVQGRSVDPAEWLDGHWIRDNLASKVPVPGV